MRLIDADKLIDEIKNSLWDWESVDGITATTVLKQTITDIGNQQTIDAVPVAKCKDCIYGDDFDCPAPLPTGYLCQKGHGSHTGDWFCADGRKGNDKERGISST